MQIKEEIKATYGVQLPYDVWIRGIVGVVDVIDCVKRHPSKWKFLEHGLGLGESATTPVWGMQRLCRSIQA
jgi:hypothetical protein